MKAKFNSIKVGLASLILSMGTFSAQSQELKITDSLYVNNNTDYRTVAYKTEKEGLEDMRKLVEKSKVEEAWVFLPNWNLWYEVGKLARNYGKGNLEYNISLELDLPYVKKLMKENSELILYHFHPEFVPKEIRRLISEQSITIQTALPSPDDLSTAVSFEREFFEHH